MNTEDLSARKVTDEKMLVSQLLRRNFVSPMHFSRFYHPKNIDPLQISLLSYLGYSGLIALTNEVVG